MTLNELIHLLQFADSALPVGAFAFSNALETAVEQRVVYDAATLAEFVGEQLRQSATSDGVAALVARRATLAGDYEALLSIDNRTYRLGDGEKITLRKACEKILLVQPHNISFYQTLHSKMGWDVDIRN